MLGVIRNQLSLQLCPITLQEVWLMKLDWQRNIYTRYSSFLPLPLWLGFQFIHRTDQLKDTGNVQVTLR